MSQNTAIVVVAFNRPQALQGLLGSLLKADYRGLDVPLIISIDGGGDKAVIALADSFHWPFGTKVVMKQPTALGLKNHIIASGSTTNLYPSVIVLEDDLEVAPGFYGFALDAVKTCATEPTIAGISLYSYAITECSYEAFTTYPDGQDTYLMQFPSSWGQVWTRQQWLGFTAWLDRTEDQTHVALPPFVQRWGNQSWKKVFLQYMMDEGKYFLYPKHSFSTNKGYAGVHFALRLMLFEVSLYAGKDLTLLPIDDLQRFDAHFEMEAATLQKLAGDGLDGSFELNLFESKNPNQTKAKYFIGPLNHPDSKALTINYANTIKAFSNKIDSMLTPATHYNSPVTVRVEEAEYYWRAKRGILTPNALGKWFFVMKYNCFKYLNAIRQRL